jgi:hypothetical protein
MSNSIENELKALKGYYVVNTKDSWVYDVEVYDSNEKIAVVGFSPNQTEGALFWQVDFAKITKYNIYIGKITDLARKFMIKYRENSIMENF